ncbi:hypothetical protein MICRO8M_140053 [Microbacterium sp. 8M]|nr:hypothetical protein MICRO8M_140053 [Microbacterium sp. 8M]
MLRHSSSARGAAVRACPFVPADCRCGGGAADLPGPAAGGVSGLRIACAGERREGNVRKQFVRHQHAAVVI